MKWQRFSNDCPGNRVSVALQFATDMSSCSHGPLDPAAIVNAVLEGVQAVNQKDATAYAVARIDYRPTTCRLRARIKCWLL